VRIVSIDMNSKTLAIILVVVSVALAGGLLYRHGRAVKEKTADTETIQKLTTEVTETKEKLDDQKAVNMTLQRDLDAHVEQVKIYSNNLASVSANLTKTQNESQAAAESAKAEILKRDARIAELESERDDLTKRMTELNGSITNLESQIAETQRKLEASEGDREFLLKELKRLQTEKAELERQFNDLALLREQVRKLKDELSIAKRLEWIRRGIYGFGLKGAEKLQRGLVAPAPKTNYNLDVELQRDGAVRVIPPVTNAPSAKGGP
jgi:DNA repair exonuclease SbcCD ATPase subunit